MTTSHAPLLPDGPQFTLQAPSAAVRHVPRILGVLAGSVVVGLVLEGLQGGLFLALVSGVVGFTVGLALMRAILGERLQRVDVDFSRQVMVVDGREVAFGTVVEGHVYPWPVPPGQAEPTGGQVAVEHELIEAQGDSLRLRLAGSRPRGMNRQQLQTYGQLLAAVDFSPHNVWVRQEQDEIPGVFGADPDQVHPWDAEWRRAELQRDVDALLRRPEHDGTAVEASWRDREGGSERFMSEEAREARRAHLSETTGSGTHAHGLAQHHEVIDQVGREVAAGARRHRRVQRGLGIASCVLGLVAAVLLAAGLTAMALEAEEAGELLLGTCLLLLPVTWVVLMAHGVAHDLHILRMRREGDRLLAPGTPGGHGTAVLYTNWWNRIYGVPTQPEDSSPNPDAPFPGLDDPTRDPRWLVGESLAAPDEVTDAWSRNPRRWQTRSALTGALIAIGLFIAWAETQTHWLLYLAASLLIGSLLLHQWARNRNSGRRPKDLTVLAQTLEEMRTDPAYGAHLSR